MHNKLVLVCFLIFCFSMFYFYLKNVFMFFNHLNLQVLLVNLCVAKTRFGLFLCGGDIFVQVRNVTHEFWPYLHSSPRYHHHHRQHINKPHHMLLHPTQYTHTHTHGFCFDTERGKILTQNSQ